MTYMSKCAAPFFLETTVILWTAESNGYVLRSAISRFDGAWSRCGNTDDPFRADGTYAKDFFSQTF